MSIRIGVISDTHTRTIDGISTMILKTLAEVDLIIHAGDFSERAVLDGLRRIGEVRAVSGNMDSLELKKLLPQKEIFLVGEKKMGLIHGSGGPWGITNRIRELFSGVDIIVYGHSHEPCNQYIRGTLMFNPGQARNSFGLLIIDDKIKAEIMRV